VQNNMLNESKSVTPLKAVLSDAEMATLINIAAIKPGKTSPLAQIKAAASPEAAHVLQQAGLLDTAGRPTSGCLECLNILANPGSEIDLLWGNPDGLSLSKAFAAPGKDRLVAFTSLHGSHRLSYFLSSADITDLIVEKTSYPEIKESPDLEMEANPSTIPVFFALLDLYREAQLKAALERRQDFQVTASPEDINRLAQEAKLENILSWYSPAGYMAIASDIGLTDTGATEEVDALKSAGLIGANNDLLSRITDFAHGAFPLVIFLGIKVITPVEKTQIALFRGISTLLLVQLTSDNGLDKALISSISTSQLPEILSNLSTRPLEAIAQPPAISPGQTASNTLACAKCGTPNAGGSKFCLKCGATISVPEGPKYCSKCGTPLKIAGKFCEKCGTKLL
jgi:hypothetical protein